MHTIYTVVYTIIYMFFHVNIYIYNRIYEKYGDKNHSKNLGNRQQPRNNNTQRLHKTQHHRSRKTNITNNRTMKQRITLSIDQDVYIKAKAEGDNLSQTVSDLLRNYYSVDELDIEETQVERQLDDITNQINTLQKKAGDLTAQLVAIREKKRKEKKEWLEKAIKMQETMRLNNPLRQ